MSTRVKNPSELNALRENAQRDLSLRSGPKDIRVTVHMGTCGIAAGARDVLSLLMKELSSVNVDTVTLRHAGCAGLCDQEPMLTVTDATGREYRYGKLDKSKVRQIVEGHLRGGAPVENLLVRA
jgi:NADP-reducing hydrogenase subunit HndB